MFITTCIEKHCTWPLSVKEKDIVTNEKNLHQSSSTFSCSTQVCFQNTAVEVDIHNFSA